MLVRICDRFADLIGIVSLIKSANRTCNDTLSTVDTAGLTECLFKDRSNMRIKSSVISTDYTDLLNVLTCSNATTAKNTLVVVANDGSGVVDLVFVLYAAELFLVYAVLVAELLKLAGGAAYAGETLTVVVRKKQLEVGLSGLVDLGGVGQNLHSLGYGINASSNQSERSAALRYFNKAKTASA